MKIPESEFLPKIPQSGDEAVEAMKTQLYDWAEGFIDTCVKNKKLSINLLESPEERIRWCEKALINAHTSLTVTVVEVLLRDTADSLVEGDEKGGEKLVEYAQSLQMAVAHISAHVTDILMDLFDLRVKLLKTQKAIKDAEELAKLYALD